MSAPTHTRSLPPGPRAHAAAGAGARLHWWALALPVLAFSCLLLLLPGSGEAHAATGEVSSPMQVVTQILRAVG
ncbi:hypothetical protein [Streptomyces sp. NPDC046685]|uniref:hypothetical protein n=1 Tax=Streptomyces sp. NPDC046685 TaxID=3157202 RepID=UPI0033FAE4C0